MIEPGAALPPTAGLNGAPLARGADGQGDLKNVAAGKREPRDEASPVS